MSERIDGVVQGLKDTLDGLGDAWPQLFGVTVYESRWLQVDQVIRTTSGSLYMHPINVRMLSRGEDRTTATLGWKLDELEAWALRRHETRCNIAQRRGEARADRALALHRAAVERMRMRWNIADAFGVPVQVITPMGAGGGWLVDRR